jgi:hypothetical protein
MPAATGPAAVVTHSSEEEHPPVGSNRNCLTTRVNLFPRLFALQGVQTHAAGSLLNGAKPTM